VSNHSGSNWRSSMRNSTTTRFASPYSRIDRDFPPGPCTRSHAAGTHVAPGGRNRTRWVGSGALP
jgi:hypothetical protein